MQNEAFKILLCISLKGKNTFLDFTQFWMRRTDNSRVTSHVTWGHSSVQALKLIEPFHTSRTDEKRPVEAEPLIKIYEGSG